MSISTGCWDFDEFLKGGYLQGGITLIYGVAATGKTTLGMLAACKEARKGRVFFLDTEGGFSVDRIKQMCEDYDKVLENIFVLGAKDFDEQEEKVNLLGNILGRVKSSLVVVDTLGMHYRKKMKEEDHRLVNARVRRMLDELGRLAKQYNIAVLVNNQVYHNFEGEVKMVGGDMVKKTAGKCIKLENNGDRFALVDGKKFKFEIVDEGIKVISL